MNSLGNIFTVVSFGESHGSHVGCVIDGCPSNLKLDRALIQEAVNKRKTNQQNFASSRNETDRVEIISGIFEEKTLGSPICILIKNENANSSDYDSLKEVFRPSHADFTYHEKYHHRDHRGGGRSSIRITAPMVAAGEIARQLLCHYFNFEILTFVSQIGTEILDKKKHIVLTNESIDASPVKCPDEFTSIKMCTLIDTVKKEGDTLGGVISCVIKNLPSGLGEPVFAKLQAQLAHTMLNINTVKAFEYGDGILSAVMKGSEHNDEFNIEENKIITSTNHHGGILGGISSGMDITFKVYFKPISSIKKMQQTVNKELKETNITIEGRHDVCAVPRAVPIVAAYSQIILADLFLQNKISSI